MDGSCKVEQLHARTSGMLAATTKRSERPERQLFVEPRTEADNRLLVQKLPFKVNPAGGWI
jgi:hypothetical protein